MTGLSTHTIVSALVNRYMDSGTDEGCHDYASEYGEPRYSANGPVLLGDWWCERKNCGYPTREDGTREIHGMEHHYPRVFAALAEAGAELGWYDEWTVIDDRAYRTTADSYRWQPSIVWNEDESEWLVNGEDPDAWIDWAVNDSRRCLLADSVSASALSERGFVERECGYYNGWHEGMDDDPAAILAAIQRAANVDVLFLLAESSQFYVRFCVYVREGEEVDGDD
jgi:hypothetical protein